MNIYGSHNIAVKFKTRDKVIYYTKAVYHLLRADPEVEYIIDCNTGEILYNRD